MRTQAFSPEVQGVLDDYVAAALKPSTKAANVDGSTVEIPYPYPSPSDWRDCWIYFLLIDRFKNPDKQPVFAWNEKYGFRQGGTFKGVQSQLAYLQQLGVNAIWLSPVLKNTKPEVNGFAYAYPGYNTQDFFSLEGRFASDGTEATAEIELAELIDEAHARGIRVIVDIVLNHAGRVFDYVRQDQVQSSFTDHEVLYGLPGNEPPIQWINGFGIPRGDWQNTSSPPELVRTILYGPSIFSDRSFFADAVRRTPTRHSHRKTMCPGILA